MNLPAKDRGQNTVVSIGTNLWLDGFLAYMTYNSRVSMATVEPLQSSVTQVQNFQREKSTSQSPLAKAKFPLVFCQCTENQFATGTNYLRI